MSKNKDFKIREYHVFLVADGQSEFPLPEYLWKKLNTFTSLSESVKFARWCKRMDRKSEYRVLGEFDYEEI